MDEFIKTKSQEIIKDRMVHMRFFKRKPPVEILRQFRCNTFSIILPPYWKDYVIKKNIQTFYNPKGYGTVDISLYSINDKSKALSPKENMKKVWLTQFKSKNVKIVVYTKGEYEIANCTLHDEGKFWRIMVIESPSKMAYLTYNCEKGKEDEESKEVNQMFDSFTFL